MSYSRRLLACVVVSVLVHVLLERGAELLPEQPALIIPHKVSVRIIEPTPKPKPKPKQVEAVVQPESQPQNRAQPRTRPTRHPPVHVTQTPPKTPHTTPTERPATTPDTTATPVFGATMESTSQAGTGPAIPTGNTLQVPGKGPVKKAAGKHLPPPVEAYAATKMPLPVGRCSGRYTDEARAAAVEGTVVLDLVVGEDGRPRQIKVIHGLPHGLTRAAVRALSRCRFTPGEHDGHPVSVRIRSFKVSFSLRDSE